MDYLAGTLSIVCDNSSPQFFEKQQEKLRKQENILMQRLERFPAEKINLYEQFRSGMVKQDVFLKEKEQLSRQEEVVRGDK